MKKKNKLVKKELIPIVFNTTTLEQELNDAIINSVNGMYYVFTSSMSREERELKFKEMIRA